MAVELAWVFGEETAAQLHQMGWSGNTTDAAFIAPNADYQYKGPGAPASRSISLSDQKWLVFPHQYRPSVSAGCIQVAVRGSPGSTAGASPWLIGVAAPAYPAAIVVSVTSAGETRLFMNGVFKSTSAASYDFDGGWQIITLWYDVTANPWKAKIQVNGATSNAEATAATAAVAAGSMEYYIQGARGTLQTHFGALIHRSGYASAAPVGRYCTRLGVDADVSTVGTWTQTGAATNHGCVGGSFDDTKHLEEAAPSVNDEVVCGYSANLGTKLGYTPSAIDAVVCYSFSEGSALGCATTIGDSTSTTVGSTDSIGATTTPSKVVAETKPSGGAWGGGDTLRPGFRVITT